MTERPFSEYGFDDFVPKPVSLEKVGSMCESSQVNEAGLRVEAYDRSRGGVREGAFGGYHFHDSDGSFNAFGSGSGQNSSSMDSIDDDSKGRQAAGGKERPSVLIGEDSLSVVKMLRKICVNAGFSVATITSSAELLSRLKSATYDLLLVDNKLDDDPSSATCSGTAAIKTLKSWEAATGRQKRQKNIFSISGAVGQDGGGEEDGGIYDGFLEKPIPFELLEKLLGTVKRR